MKITSRVLRWDIHTVIPAKAGIQFYFSVESTIWIPGQARNDRLFHDDNTFRLNDYF